MENFIEYAIPYRMTYKDQIKRAVLTVLPMIAGVVMIMMLSYIGILICCALIYLSYRVYMSFRFEWEYSLVENELSFAKVINKERRRDLLTGDIAKTESYGPLEKCPRGTLKTHNYLAHTGDDPAYFWITTDKKGDRICILFQPDERIRAVFAVRARGKLIQ